MTNFLINRGHKVLSTYYRPTTDINELSSNAEKKECDIRDKEMVFSIIKKFKPDKIFHFAAQSYPQISWKDPWYTIETNVIGTTNIFEAIKSIGSKCKILNICSSAEYGFIDKNKIPIKEDNQLNPLHPYGVSKLAQEKLAYQYFKNFDINSVSIRLFNTTGPRKINDICSDFTKRLIEIEKGIKKDKRLIVGNLKSERAILDVRDVVNAFDLALDKCVLGEVYNLSGEYPYKILDIIEILRKLVSFKFELEQDDKLIRSTDEAVIYGDSTKFKEITGWKQEIPLQQTLQDMLNYWRIRLNNTNL
jgi:nucleoside-diphosphate-sugar epimerase